MSYYDATARGVYFIEEHADCCSDRLLITAAEYEQATVARPEEWSEDWPMFALSMLKCAYLFRVTVEFYDLFSGYKPPLTFFPHGFLGATRYSVRARFELPLMTKFKWCRNKLNELYRTEFLLPNDNIWWLELGALEKHPERTMLLEECEVKDAAELCLSYTYTVKYGLIKKPS